MVACDSLLKACPSRTRCSSRKLLHRSRVIQLSDHSVPLGRRGDTALQIAIVQSKTRCARIRVEPPGAGINFIQYLAQSRSRSRLIQKPKCPADQYGSIAIENLILEDAFAIVASAPRFEHLLCRTCEGGSQMPIVTPRSDACPLSSNSRQPEANNLEIWPKHCRWSQSRDRKAQFALFAWLSPTYLAGFSPFPPARGEKFGGPVAKVKWC
jgi:hypothetical protein